MKKLSKKAKKSNLVKYIIIFVVALALIITGVLCYKKLSNKNHFFKNTYYKCDPTSNLDGPMTFYLKFDSKGRYVEILSMPRFIDAGTYEKKDGKIVLNQEFYKSPYKDTADISKKTYEYEHKDGIIVVEDYKCSKTSSKQFKELAKSAGFTSYDDLKKSAK